ncbi:MAG: FMN-binding protein [Christensenellales bacterium]|jgi:uncharacterized protein with FMN-binding domain
MRTFLKIIIVLVVLIAIGFAGFQIASRKIVSDAVALPVEEIDISKIEDGTYPGSYAIFPVKVSVETTILQGKITRIDLLEHFNGKGATAEIIVDHIIDKQSLQVDGVSGATVSSVAIKKAVEDSLNGA